MEISRVTTPKEFFVKERDSFYSLWTLSFWREFFQNSVDAGSKNIGIEISTEKGRGEFDKIGDASKQITRVVFTDDGCGMNEEVLNKVYFAIGQTTKNDGSSVGGYGRARLMTCFSQDRYSILTKDRFVMGNGPDYVNLSLDEAEAELLKALDELPEPAGDDDESRINHEVSRAGLRRDLRMVQEAKALGGFNGCRVEVDLDQSTGNYRNRPTTETMNERLRTYLSESQIKPNVTINGKTPEEYYETENKIQARRGQTKRTLATEVDGQMTEFATVHISESDKAIHKGKAIIRVDGASMYTVSLDPEVQVIIEINQKLSRLALTSNRDGMKEGFSDALHKFITELNVDNTSALADKVSKDNYKIEGDKGMLIATLPSLSNITSDNLSFEEEHAAVEISTRVKSSSVNTLEDLKERGISQDAIEELVKKTHWGESIVSKMRWSYDFPLKNDVEQFINSVQDGIYEGDAKADIFLKYASAPLKEWVIQTLGTRNEKALEQYKAETEQRLKDMNDVFVSVVSTNEKTRAAIRRNDPRKWDIATGKGRVPRALLSSWTAACSVAVETLMRARPSTSDFRWTTGWVYSVPEETFQGDRSRSVSIEAMCSLKDSEYKFLLNPIKEDGVLRYSVTDAKDRQHLQALAMHEVAHVLEHYHNESYAGVLTDLMINYDFSEANKRMKESVKAVLSAYESGRAVVQPMDNEPGPRPAERLMALATANDPEAAAEAITYNEDGTYQVDTERLQDHVEGYDYAADDANEVQFGYGR